MTPEEQQAAEQELIRFQEQNPDYWGEQDENGVDIARLRENLRLTPVERLQRLEASRSLFDIIPSHAQRKNTIHRGGTNLL